MEQLVYWCCFFFSLGASRSHICILLNFALGTSSAKEQTPVRYVKFGCLTCNHEMRVVLCNGDFSINPIAYFLDFRHVYGLFG